MSTVCVNAQEIHTYVNRDSVQVGDIIEYTIVLEKENEYESIQFPDEEMINSDDLSFISRNHFRVNTQRDSVVYELQFFGVEDYRIPGLDITLFTQESDTTLTTTPVPLFFKTVLTEDDDTFRPLKPIFDFARIIWPYLILLILTGLILAYIYKRYREKVEKTEPTPPLEPIPFKSPITTLQEALHTLSGRDSPLENKNFKEFYVLLGDSIRQYFEETYKIDALEMTSREILIALQEFPADKRIIDITRKVLNEADMVKFANFKPTTDQARRSLTIANEFLQTVKEVDRHRIDRLKDQHNQKQMEITGHPENPEGVNT
ncbi:MAG: hypothetical protein WD035_08680 [Balneolaceae bacterium]